MKKVLFLFAIVSMITLTACQSSGEKAADEIIECMNEALDNSSDLEEFESKLKECRDNLRRKYQDKINDSEFLKDVEKKFADFDKKIEEKAREKFGKE